MLSVGIVGLPNVGKSTLFNALTNKAVDAANYPFCTIDPSVGVVAVPDRRLGKLAQFSQSAKTIPAAIEFVDIAGLVKGAAQGEGLGNQFLAHIRETDAIAQVVRIFSLGEGSAEEIIHIYGAIDPLRDIEIINLELILADLGTVTKRLQNLGKEVKRGDKDASQENEVLRKVYAVLEAGRSSSELLLSVPERKIVATLHLLTQKPMLYVLNRALGGRNLDELGLSDPGYTKLMDYFRSVGAVFVVVDAGLEQELKELDNKDKAAFREELGVDDGINDLIASGYRLLDLVTFFTTGQDETRAWTILRNSTAPVAGAAIHSDFRDKFIRAEVINWETLLKAGSYAAARERGLLRTEGKQYVVQDGDVIEFKI